MYAKFLPVLLAVALSIGCAAAAGPQTDAGTDPQGKTGILMLTVNATLAEVSVDGALYGMVKKGGRAQSFVIPAGAHTLVIKKFGYKDYTAKVAVEAGAINTLDITMERLPTEVVTMPEDEAKK